MKKRPRPDADEGGSHGDAMQSWLCAAGGSLHPALRFGTDPFGGSGVFSTGPVAAPATLIFVPRQCILSLQATIESPIGRKLRDALLALDAELAPEEATEIAAWLWMAMGRRAGSDQKHPFHAYLASLPSVTDDVACWPAAQRSAAGLEATPVADEIEQALGLAAYCADLAARLPKRLQPNKGGCVSTAEVLWARGIFLSRGFPAGLLDAAGEHEHRDAEEEERNSSLGGCVGCLLPGIDVANHRAGAAVSWIGSADGVALRTDAALGAGVEVFNNCESPPTAPPALHCPAPIMRLLLTCAG